MIGSFLTRSLALVLGYAYPAYECFKAVELNKPDIEQLVFWCQYWILVASLTVLERVGDNFISWVPMYSEAKLAFFVYLWYPKTKGTTYVYETFFRPYVAKHESEIDRNLLELRTRAGDFVMVYLQKAASYGQTRFFEVLQYIASQSPSQSSRSHPPASAQQRPKPPRQVRRTTSATATQQPAPSQPQQRTSSLPSSPSENQLQETTEATASVAPPAPGATQQPKSSSFSSQSNPESSSLPKLAGEGETAQDIVTLATDEDQNPQQVTPIEEAIRVTRGRLRKRAAIDGAAR